VPTRTACWASPRSSAARSCTCSLRHSRRGAYRGGYAELRRLRVMRDRCRRHSAHCGHRALTRRARESHSERNSPGAFPPQSAVGLGARCPMRVKGSHAKPPQSFSPQCDENLGAGCREGRLRALDPRSPRACSQASGTKAEPRRAASVPREEGGKRDGCHHRIEDRDNN